MKLRKVALILSAWLLAPGLALAQPGPGAPPPAQPPMSVEGRAQMYEDIEILRRLLDARLVDEYPPARQTARVAMNDCARCHGGDPRTSGKLPTPFYQKLTRNPDPNVANGMGEDSFWVDNDNGTLRWWINNGAVTKWTRELEDAHRGVPGWDGTAGAGLNTEGVYLKGQGVVYTLHLPPPAHDPTAGTSRPPSQAGSPWERVRRELHGGKPEPAEKESPRAEASLAEIVLRALAENGRHFTAELPENESITVVITFRGARPQAGQPGGGPVPTVPPGKRPRVPMTFQQNPGLPGAPPAGTSFSSEQDYELYGDLNLKQGKPDEAVQAYRKALEMKPDAKQSAALHRKLAQACLAQGKVEEARQFLDKALEATRNTATQPAATTSAATHSPLPAKLIVSASRRLLDLVGSGRIDFEAFRKEASVEYLTFPSRPE